MAFKSTRPPPVAPVGGNVGESEPSGSRRTSSHQLDMRAEQRVMQLEEELHRERRIGVALREVGLALGTTLDLGQLLELILQKIIDAVEADRATLYLLDEAKNELVSRIVQGEEVRSIRLKVGQGIAGSVAQTSKALLVNDPYSDSRFNPEWDMTSGYRTRSILAVPMKNHLGKTIGVIQVLNKKSGLFTDHDAVILAALATQAAISIDNSRLFLSVTQKNTELLEIKEQLEHRVRDLKLLFDLESAMGRATSMEELFTGVLSEAMRVTSSFAGAFALKSDDGIELFFMRSEDEQLVRTPMRPNQGFTGLALAAGEVVFTNDAKKHPAHDDTLDELLGHACRACIAVPLEGEEGEPLGAIALYDKQRTSSRKMTAEDFSEEDRALLLLIAANASTAIRLQLSREAREREERLTTIGRLLSGVIHDLKTPLTVISGYVQLMQQADKRETRKEYAELALKQFGHIVAMQRDVLEFARGEKSILIRKVYLANFFDGIREQLQTDLARGGVELIIELADKGTARFDEQKVTRVIHNVARNAMEALGKSGGKFTIKVSRDKDDLVVTMSDNGPGIPKEIETRLFQSFVTSGKKGGTGLGLAITKRIAEEHGGTISVHSSSKGASFKLRLPQTEG